MEENEMPWVRYREQLRCQNGKLVVDATVKSPRILRDERKAELQKELDDELGKAEPDIIAVARLQREIEKLKKSRQIQEAN